ncbi:unnamed protein product [marine sediment metagenome]|jgi:hypothetical protein|uniref:Uncharacterized protein n=1 Tax=marine sediment metagenome TaxID=412755 RepID=X1NKN4_9ZZZZ
MSKLSKQSPDDNKKLHPLVGEISWSENLISYRDLPKVQPLVAQIGCTHDLIILRRCKEPLESELEGLNTEALKLAVIIKKNFEEAGV